MSPLPRAFKFLLLAAFGQSVWAVRTYFSAKHARTASSAQNSTNFTQKPALKFNFHAPVSIGSQTILVSANEERLVVVVEDFQNETEVRSAKPTPSTSPKDRLVLDIKKRTRYNHEHFFNETVCFAFDLISSGSTQQGNNGSNTTAPNISNAANRSEQLELQIHRMMFIGVMSELFNVPLQLYELAQASGNGSVAGLNCTSWTVNNTQVMSIADMLGAMQANGANSSSMLPAWAGGLQARTSLRAEAASAVSKATMLHATAGARDATITESTSFCVMPTGQLLEASMHLKVTVQEDIQPHANVSLSDSNGTDSAGNSSNGSSAVQLEETILFEQSRRTALLTAPDTPASPEKFNGSFGVTGDCADLTQGSVGPSELLEGLNSLTRLARINAEAFGHWEAAPYDFWDGLTVDRLVPSLGTKIGPLKLPLRQGDPARIHGASFLKARLAVPPSFDARAHWPACISIGLIRNQGPCGSCWAVAAATVMSDRFCIAASKRLGNASGNTSLIQLSDLQALMLAPEQMVDCDETNNGCQGGRLDDAWTYLKDHGVPRESCSPYRHCPVPTSKQCFYGDASQLPKKPDNKRSCTGQCVNGDKMDVFQVSAAYAVAKPRDVVALQRELLERGPVEVAFFVFSDFMNYKRGTYFRTPAAYGPLGGHAVRLLGWGTEEQLDHDPVDYWLVANSWSVNWGMGGLFRIRRGTNECGIETTPAAGLPKLDSFGVEAALKGVA
eukprot:TRINITY_DN43452_c0_g1_i1.p1 TRINITY_DN43452_c0_g1~~TRINITY_DN43452_c0_g1_i1.p1  ORF type:complete len:746 (-),score=151.36 TRINITY_DN43452_c0_g1_i1:64-2250(-)